ncbi:MAG TPA: TIGR04290 family methyltransferase [Bryobacteraceae bacterium]|nr:TIGR04290 family methyltransferase [Bryobacteraceae bacterium]
MSLASSFTGSDLERKIAELGPWFHNINLQGVQTAPQHFLGDYPSNKFRNFRDAIPSDLTGMTVLDIGCNGGFYSVEMKQRGASRVLGIDHDEGYLAQARFAADVLSLEIEFRQMSVYDLPQLNERFDLVLFMGVFYHLRYPLLALDLLRQHVAKDWFVFQSMQRGSRTRPAIETDYQFWQTSIFDHPGYPKMHFVENSYSQDPTNWWIPNRACTEAVLRSAGFRIASNPEEEVFICKCDEGAYLHPIPVGLV